MKRSRILILACMTALTFSSCSKSFSCHCALKDKVSGLDNGSRVIQMDIKAFDARKRAEKNCAQNEVELNSDIQSANCHLQ